jgi:predicted glycoside hydrolase/deacetylase ChbG (UPF0249 family)
MTRPLLVVTADDYGLTRGVCRAIVSAHRAGVVRATSVLAVGSAFDYGAGLLRDEPALAVGAHLAMVGEDPPLLTAREIPTLVDRRGRLPLSYRSVVMRAATRRIDPDDMRREFRAQLERIRRAGLHVSHVDTHQHVHLWPSIGGVVAELAAQSGGAAVRLPGSASRGPAGMGVRVLRRRLAARLERAGLRHPDGYAGLDEAGRLDRRGLQRALRRFAADDAASAEINAHPGEADPELTRFDWGYRWAAELDLLRDPGVAALIEASGFRLGSMDDLPMMPARPPARRRAAAT